MSFTNSYPINTQTLDQLASLLHSLLNENIFSLQDFEHFLSTLLYDFFSKSLNISANKTNNFDKLKSIRSIISTFLAHLSDPATHQSLFDSVKSLDSVIDDFDSEEFTNSSIENFNDIIIVKEPLNISDYIIRAFNSASNASKLD